MPCSFPIPALQLEDGTVVFYEKTGHASVRSLFLPCGRCVRCRLERSRQWAVRCMHEAKLYDRNCFITLTYDEKNVPADLSLRYVDFQLFMKRLRRRFFSDKIRFYMCGEYGEGFGRPHYHACLFNFDFPDKLYFKKAGDAKLYTSAVLGELWPLGFALIGSVSFQSAAYVARYCMKVINGKDADAHYRVVDPDTGEVRSRVPEFGKMSLRPGIGAPWLAQFKSDVYPKGQVIVNGKEAKAPRYYDKIFEREDTVDEYSRLQLARYKRAAMSFADDTDERNAVKEQVATARLASYRRSL